MLRKILNIFAITLLLMFTIWLGIRLFHRITNPQADLSHAVPNDAALVIRLSDPILLWNQLNGSSLLWSELKSVHPFRQTHIALAFCDSLISADAEFRENFSGKPVLLSVHPTGNKGIETMLAIELPSGGEKKCLSMLERALKQTFSVREFKSESIYNLTLGNAPWQILIKENFLTISSSATLAERISVQLDQDISIATEAGWKEVYSTADIGAQANIFIHHQNFSKLIHTLVQEEQNDALTGIYPYAYFTEFDLSLRSGTVSLNGFSFAPDSLGSMLNIFSKHEPQPFEVARYLPDNTAAFLWLGINDGESFRTSIDAYRQSKGTLQQYQKEINSFNADKDCNIERQLVSWIGNEIVLFSNGKADTSAKKENLFLAIRINDVADPISELNALADKLDTNATRIRDQDGMQMRRLLADDLFSLLFGPAFDGIDNPWYIRIEDYMILANSGEALKQYLMDISSDRTLGKNITYYNFVSENLSDRANLSVYVNPSKFKSLLPQFFNTTTSEELGNPNSLLWKFDALAWQFSNSGKGMFYNNLYLKYNGTGKQDSKSLWEVALDTTVNMQPLLVKNHITGTMDVVVQDENYNFFLISSKGEILWKKQLEERLTGDVRQIDFFGNGKLQLLFATTTAIHLIDLKGNYLKGFPYRLKEEVSGPLGVFDYESNNNYRILIPCGKNIVNIDKEAKVTTGWEPEKFSSDINQAPVFFRCDNKDYLFVIDKQGEIRIIDRKGKPRYNLSFSLENRSSNKVILEQGSSIEGTSLIYSDTSGRIIRTFLNGNADTARTGLKSSSHRFAYIDANEDGKKDIVLLDSNKIDITEWSGKRIGVYHFPERVSSHLMVFALKDGSIRIGAVAPGVGEIYLLNSSGQLHGKFPLTGTTAFPLSDINGDGSLEVVSGTGSRRIVCYSLN